MHRITAALVNRITAALFVVLLVCLVVAATLAMAGLW